MIYITYFKIKDYIKTCLKIMNREGGLLYCKTDTLLRKAAMKLSNTD